MKQVQDVIERLWDFIDKLDINTFGKFVEINCFYILNSEILSHISTSPEETSLDI